MADLHLLLDAKHRFLEADGEIQAQVVPLVGPSPPGALARSRPAKTTEKGLKQVGKATHVAHVGHAAAAAETRLAELVVAGPGLGIAEHLVGLADLLELVFGARILVDIRVVLARQPPIGALQGFGISITAHPKQVVVIGHQPTCSPGASAWASGAAPPAGPGPIETFTRAWRSTRPLRW